MMKFPAACVQTISIYHLPSVAGSAQAYPGTADLTISTAVLPIDRKQHALAGINLIDPWELYMDVTADVRLNDKIVLANDTANYYVCHVFKAAFGSLSHQRITITKQS